MIATRLAKSGTISSIATGSPGVFTTGVAHGLSTGDTITIAATNTVPASVGAWNVTVISPTTFSINNSSTAGGAVNITTVTTGTGTWTSNAALISSNTLVATPVFTTSTNHGLAGGQQITIRGSTSTPSYNGTWTVATVPTVTTFTLTGAPSAVAGVSGWGAYTIVGTLDTLVAANASDLQTVNATTNNGWALFKLASSGTLTAATTYNLQIAGSSAGNWTPYRTATAGDWARALRTTTTQAPVASDVTLICGQYSAPGSNSAYTVTVDSAVTSATSYGAIEICGYGTLSFTTAASVNPYLKIAGSTGTNTTGIQGYTGGTYSQGTQASPIPSTSTAKLEFACASPVQYGFDTRAGFTLNTGGNAITNISAKLAADASAAATSLTTNIATGWKNGDSIAIAATTRTRLESEKVLLTADASGTTLTVGALTNAHGGGGTALVIAEIINLTRNVSIFSTSTTNTGYVNLAGSTTTNIQYTEFYNLGSATANKRGIDIGANTTASIMINGCSIHDFLPASATGTYVNSATAMNITVSSTNYYNITGNCLVTTAIASLITNNTYSNLIGILSGTLVFNFADLQGTISNITAVSGGANGIGLVDTMAALQIPGSCSGLVAHSNTGIGINFTNITNYTNNPFASFSNITSWRNTTYGMQFSNSFGLIVDGSGSGQLFGNATANVVFGGSCANVYLRNLISNAGTILTCPVGVALGNDMKDAYVDNSTFGATTTHATGDFSWAAANIYTRLVARNCSFNSATTVANILANAVEGSEVASARHQQTAGNNRSFKKFGTISTDTTIFNTSSPSTRLTPSSANGKLQSGYKKVAIPNNQTATINVWVRKSVAGDGTAYTGNQARLIQRADAATGNNTDVVLASTTNAANGAFQLLSATVAAVTDDCAITLYVDCDGAAGWINVDDWSVT
jgi:hypothetical protein